MPLVTSTEMFRKAYNGGYAIGAFNVNNMRVHPDIQISPKPDLIILQGPALRNRKKTPDADGNRRPAE